MRFACTAIVLALAVGGAAPAAPGAQNLDAAAPVSYFIDDGAGIPGYAPGDREVAVTALAAWSRESGGVLRFVEAAEPDDAQVRLTWGAPSRGLFGQTHYTLVNGRPGAVVFVVPDVQQLGAELAGAAGRDPLLRDAIVYLTAVHELGHAVGLGHTAEFADIMYSFAYGGDFLEYFMRYRRNLGTRADIARHSGLSDADRRALERLYPAR